MEDVGTRYPIPGEDLTFSDLPPLSQTYIQSVAAEIAADHPEWSIYEIDHLRLLPIEAYLVLFTNGFKNVYVRNAQDQLTPAAGWSYYAPDHYADMHETMKGDQTNESPEKPLP